MRSARWEVVLFDLDGTLTDPAEGITASLAHALTAMGRPVPSREVLAGYIGPPLLGIFEAEGVPVADRPAAIDAYRERFGNVGLFENEVYDGIPELLAAVRASGSRIGLATAKPDVFAERILDHFGLRPWFDVVGGSELDLRRTDKHEVIAWALDRLDHRDRSTVVMVGDRRHDVDGARRCGVTSVGVTWGYGSEDELRSAGVDHLVGSVAELERLLAGG